MSESLIRMAAKIYEARDTMRRLLGDRYAGRIARCRPAISAYMEMHGVDEVTAAIRLAKDGDNPFVTGILFATAVEMVEPPENDTSDNTTGKTSTGTK
jgi:hypothetical protein